jgi:hypothetical protein
MTTYQQRNVGMTTIKYAEYLGVNVCKEVLELMDEIKKKNPMLQFTVGGNRTSFFDDQNQRVEVKTSMFVHDASDPDKQIGGIGYDTDEKYWVRSRLIRNEKYGRWNTSQHQSKFSKHMKNIVKEAVKSLKPLTYEEVVNENSLKVERAINSMHNNIQGKINSNMRLDFTDMFPELLHMHNIGYVPSTPKMAQAISWAVESKDELEKYYNYNPKKVMIWVRPNSVVYEIDGVVTQVNSTAELPEELRGKLFVLDVTDKGQFIEDVGMKQDTGIYWVLL